MWRRWAARVAYRLLAFARGTMEYENTTVKSVEAFLRFVQEAMPDVARFIYRGQVAQFVSVHNDVRDTQLIPSLFRQTIQVPRMDTYAEMERRLLSDFRRESRPYVQHAPKTLIEWMALGQHHGLPTRLLDWTFNPLAALFFAVMDEDDQFDAHVYQAKVYDHQLYADAPTTELDPKEEPFRLYCPEHLDIRLQVQESCFTLHPIIELHDLEAFHLFFAETAPEALSVRRCVVPKDVKSQVKIQLAMISLTYRTFFPGLDGVCKTVTWKNTGDTGYLRKLLKKRKTSNEVPNPGPRD